MRLFTAMTCTSRGRESEPGMYPVRQLLTGGFLVLLAGCSVLPKAGPGVQDRYMLEYTASASPLAEHAELPVMIVTAPRAHGGYDTARIAYLQQQYGLRYFARSRWADTPARMLAPLLAEAVSATGACTAVFAPPGSLSAKYRLNSELIRLHQDFSVQPSEVHLTLRVQLVEVTVNRVLATRLFDIRETAASDDTYGGVQAANALTARLLEEVAAFSLQYLD